MSVEPHGLRTQDSPPLAIPVAFFLTGTLALVAAGALLAWNGASALGSRWSPITLCLTHLGTLGFLSMVMLGALYQMVAVVVGSPAPWIRLAHVVHALFTAGVAAFCWGIARVDPDSVLLAIYLLGPAVLLFVVPVSVALARARSWTPTTFGIASAVGCLLLTATAGVWMAHGFADMRFPGPRDLWVQVHLGLAFVGWVGSLVTAVSWQVVPMFYLAREQPRRLEWSVQGLALAGALMPLPLLWGATLGLLGLEASGARAMAAVALAPGAIAVWLVHPAAVGRGLRRRRRKRSDGSLLFWRAGLAMAPVCAVVAAAAGGLPSERWDLLLGWVVVWGWAGAIVHGMLTRIVPFLVWLHRFAPRVGREPVPSVRKLLPDAWIRLGFGLHLATLLLGMLAIGTGWDPAARATGVALLATALSMARSWLHVLRQR